MEIFVQDDTWALILSKLPFSEAVRTTEVCRLWRTRTRVWLETFPLTYLSEPAQKVNLDALVSTCPNLRRLKVHSRNVTLEMLNRAIQNAQSIFDLSIHHFKENSSEIWQTLGLRLSSEKCSLQQLYIGQCRLGNQGLSLLQNGFQLNHSLTSLSLYCCELDSEGVTVLMNSISPHIKTLDLCMNYVCQTGVTEIGRAIIENRCFLTDLNLQHNEITSIEGEFVEAIKQSSIIKLSLGDNKLKSKDLKLLSESFQKQNKIQNLNLIQMSLNTKKIDFMTEIIQNIHTIIVLDLSMNFMNAASFELLAQAIKINNSLQHLNLSLNSGGFRGVKTIVDILCEQKKPKLEYVDLRFNSLSKGEVQYFSNEINGSIKTNITLLIQ